MPLIGTAGHVDHGKSTLIEALTGRDPDRWDEEKRRGLTIDIGFAWANLDDGPEVSFVDVPGHERYLKNMLAGIDPIDAALFVVAADEGWMPQSEEHLAVLDLLEINHGVIAVTKTDLVDEDLLELAILEITERLAGTTLAEAPIVAVSAVTGSGMAELRTRLVEQLPDDPPSGSRPRLWVDRSFSIPGAGTVVTGTLTEGSLESGAVVEILPGGIEARVRGLQSHERELDVGEPGRRLAVNLGGVGVEQVPRGVMLGLPGQWLTTNRVTVRTRVARYADELTPRGAYQLHVGSGAHQVEIVRTEDDIALMRLRTPLPLRSGDRFIIRNTGRKLVVAGGVVLDPDPGSLVKALEHSQGIHPSAGPDAVANALLAIRGSDAEDRISIHSGGGSPTNGELIGGRIHNSGTLLALESQIVDAVRREHERHPLRAGLPVATIATVLRESIEVVQFLIDRSGELERVGPDVRVTGHHARLDDDQERRWTEAQITLRSGLAVPNDDQLGLDEEAIHLLIREGRLVRIASRIVVLPSQQKEIEAAVKGMGDGFTVAQFRDRTGLSRKHAVPYLEWADSKGLTVRRGDLRHHK